jgi:hypothetical protein
MTEARDTQPEPSEAIPAEAPPVRPLRRFRVEIVANRDTVAGVKDYHAAKLKELNEFFAAEAEG